MSVCLYVCMSACLYACMSVCLYACMPVCLYACMPVDAACVYLCVLRSLGILLRLGVTLSAVEIRGLRQVRDPSN